MKSIKYIHAADLHLDTAFSGITRAGNEDLAMRLSNSTFEALENLTRLCESEKPDFLLLAGDIYNHEEHSVRAHLNLRQMTVRLADAGIPIFISYGNHDPLSSRLRAIRFPDNVHEFGEEATVAPVIRNKETIALVHGASHVSSREARNLAQHFHRSPGENCFQIGLLHCNVDGAVTEDRYAPCSLADLEASGLDAWALGHAHKRQILADTPFIAYSGCSQGTRPTECGAQGCLIVNAVQNGTEWRCDTLFRQLGPIVWMKADIDLNGVNTLDGAVELVQDAFQNALADTQFCEGLIARIYLSGRTSLASILSKEGACDDLLTEAANSAGEGIPIWPAGVVNSTRPPDQISILDRDDLLGEIGRLGQAYSENPEAMEKFLSGALKPLYGNRNATCLLSPPDSEEMRNLIQKAQLLCQNLLEGR